MTGKRFLFVCALVLLGTVVVPSGADRQLSGDPRTGGDGLGNQVLDVLSDATALPTRANNMNTQLSEAGHRLNELNAATADCPDGFTECGDYCYHAVATKYRYTKAKQICVDMGAILATPRTAAENTCARRVAAWVRYSSFWLGYRGGRTVKSLVGDDGRGAMSYTNWDTEWWQPSLSDADNCVIMYSGGDGLWGDLGCDIISYYPLCQAPQN